MTGNFLEELISEWYQYRGYFVRQNVLVGKRTKGGYECELDVVAFNPEEGKLVHLEPSMDADSWDKRERRYKKKFEAGQKYIPGLFRGLNIPGKIEQIAVFGILKKTSHTTIADGSILSIDDLLMEIFSELKNRSMLSNAIPEHYPILRSFQLVCDHRVAVVKSWQAGQK